ncbi:deleted in malignant brain tumors 1 protein-like [Stegostoma tigrinum]|uniref:deleted in malignant brain tumors 1 protein-like n=1 Tax=Stegostoma tigrinum TaxID=3053191 RepID=UPI00286FBFD7|nr:deleted in malignant brain tumors 1 protein-like [Stegostoma tigrinum]
MGDGYCYATTSSPTCGGYLDAANGTISSPNYPYNYPDNAACFWYIRRNVNQRIVLVFTEIQLEVTSSCSYDYIEVYDGPSTHSDLLSKFCQGSHLRFVSSYNSMTIYFRTDSSVTRRGFTANYYTLDNDEVGSCRYNCGGYSSGCSCDYNCPYNGNCCLDFCTQCSYINSGYCGENSTTAVTAASTTGTENIFKKIYSFIFQSLKSMTVV